MSEVWIKSFRLIFFRRGLVLGFYSNLKVFILSKTHYQGLFLLFFFNCFWMLWCDLIFERQIVWNKDGSVTFPRASDGSNTQLQRQRQFKLAIFFRVLSFLTIYSKLLNSSFRSSSALQAACCSFSLFASPRPPDRRCPLHGCSRVFFF